MDGDRHIDICHGTLVTEPLRTLTNHPVFRWGGGLPRERLGAKKFGHVFETQGQTFWRDIPGLLPGYPRVPEKLGKKSLRSIFIP